MADDRLDPVVIALGREFLFENGRVFLPPDGLRRWYAEFLKTPEGDCRRLAENVLALAAKFRRIAGQGDAQVAVGQLLGLAAVLLGHASTAADVLQRKGDRASARMAPKAATPHLAHGLARPKNG